jgi:glucosamine-6-phosphate deaminase
VRVRIFDGPQSLAVAAADIVADAASARPELTIALPTGKTPLPLYDELAVRRAQGRLNLSQARGFNMDELVLPENDPRTFKAFIAQHVVGRTGLRGERCQAPNGSAVDLRAECRRYDGLLQAAGGLDLAILGVGVDGHVAYILPGPLRSGMHLVQLPDDVASSHGVPPELRPLQAITLGIDAFQRARRVLLLATGASKGPAIRALVAGPAREEWPCSFLTDHQQIDVLLDVAAATAASVRATAPRAVVG